MIAHGGPSGVDGGKSHSGVLADDTRGKIESGGAICSGAQGADREQMGPSDTNDTGDLDEAIVTSIRGGTRVTVD